MISAATGRRYTRAEAKAYRRMWGAPPSGYTEAKGAEEERRRDVGDHGARHALCFPSVGGGWLCRHATPGDKGCGTLTGARP